MIGSAKVLPAGRDGQTRCCARRPSGDRGGSAARYIRAEAKAQRITGTRGWWDSKGRIGKDKGRRLLRGVDRRRDIHNPGRAGVGIKVIAEKHRSSRNFRSTKKRKGGACGST